MVKLIASVNVSINLQRHSNEMNLILLKYCLVFVNSYGLWYIQIRFCPRPRSRQYSFCLMVQRFQICVCSKGIPFLNLFEDEFSKIFYCLISRSDFFFLLNRRNIISTKKCHEYINKFTLL